VALARDGALYKRGHDDLPQVGLCPSLTIQL
jgi:hypothetical protein